MKTLSPLNACWLGLLILLYLYGFLGFLVIMPIVTLATGVQGKCDGDPHILTWLEVRKGGSLPLCPAALPSRCVQPLCPAKTARWQVPQPASRLFSLSCPGVWLAGARACHL